MAIAHDAASESHAGTTGSTSAASFSWSHTPVGTPKGALVFTFVNANADDATAVTYGGTAMTAVTGGRATDTAGTDLGDCKAWFLGASIPTGVQTVVVTRTNNANEMYAACMTVTAATTTTEVYEAGMVINSESGTLAERSVNDGSPGTDSVRYAAVNSGASGVPPTGANSTALVSIDFGTRTIGTVRETTAGQGARLVGFDEASTDRAAVHLAVREVIAAGSIPVLMNQYRQRRRG